MKNVNEKGSAVSAGPFVVLKGEGPAFLGIGTAGPDRSETLGREDILRRTPEAG